MTADETMKKFLERVQSANWIQPPPKIWNRQYREALSEGFVKVGWGGRLALTDAGRTALSQSGGK